MRGGKIRGKTIIAMFGMIFLLMSITYAGILNYYGKVEGIAKVKGPIFYANSTKIYDYKQYRELLINEKAHGTRTSFTDAYFRIFVSKPLGINSFYPANYTFYVESYANVSSQIESALYICDPSSLTLKEKVCEAIINVPAGKSSDDYEISSASCIGKELTMNVNDGFCWKISGLGGPYVKYYIKLDGNTRIEVSKV